MLETKTYGCHRDISVFELMHVNVNSSIVKELAKSMIIDDLNDFATTHSLRRVSAIIFSEFEIVEDACIRIQGEADYRELKGVE